MSIISTKQPLRNLIAEFVTREWEEVGDAHFTLNDKIKHGPDEADLVPGGKLAPGLAVKDGLSND